MKAITDVNIDGLDVYSKEGANSKITNLLYFIKSIEPLLLRIKGDLSKYLMSK
jgi:hypothetical protein